MSAVIDSPAYVTRQQLILLSQYSRTLELKPGRIHAGQAGNYQSRFKGRGMEYDESRYYQPGDDIRNIDWRVTARSGRVYTKLYREERERPVFIGVDFRNPMFFATRGRYKSVVAAEIASLLAWTANQQGDRVGGLIFSEQACRELKPQRGKQSVLHFINQLCHHPVWQKNNNLPPSSNMPMDQALLRLHRLVRPGSLIFLLSDFRLFDKSARSHLINLGRHNDVILVLIHDRLESELPQAGEYRISNGDNELTIDTRSDTFRENYHSRFLQHRNELQQLCRSCKMNFLDCTTEDNPVTVLQKGLS